MHGTLSTGEILAANSNDEAVAMLAITHTPNVRKRAYSFIADALEICGPLMTRQDSFLGRHWDPQGPV